MTGKPETPDLTITLYDQEGRKRCEDPMVSVFLAM